MAAHVIRKFAVTDSTNRQAAALLRQGAEGEISNLHQVSWVIADRQTAGRGRLARTWVSEPGNLYATAIVPADPNLSAAAYPLLSGLAVADTVMHFSNAPDIKLKWPNDVFAGDAKVSGILIETVDDAHVAYEPGRYLLIGIGINVASSPKVEGRATTSITQIIRYADALSGAVAVSSVLETLDKNLSFWLGRAASAGLDHIVSAWNDRAYGVGREARFQLSNKTQSGIFLGISDDGAARFRQPDGKHVLAYAGDLVFVADGDRLDEQHSEAEQVDAAGD
ncbi:MAG: biotin--[acetyl-CoA-carboxylase] ligase [Pseudomonadota bacterium]